MQYKLIKFKRDIEKKTHLPQKLRINNKFKQGQWGKQNNQEKVKQVS